MRPFCLFLPLFCIFLLTACGSEEEITPPAFSNVTASGSLSSTTILTAPSQDDIVTITGTIDNSAVEIVANSTVTGQKTVIHKNDGTWESVLTSKEGSLTAASNNSWEFVFPPQEGINIVTFTASDERGNINQLSLTVRHDTTAPLVKAVEQSIDPAQLLVTFKESLLNTSLPTAPFSVFNAVGDTIVLDSLIATVATSSSVTLSLAVVLPPGDYRLACPGVKDIATPDGNGVAPDSRFDFTIQ